MAGIGQEGPQAAPISRTARALHEAGALEPIDQARRPAPRQDEPIGEVAHPQLAALRDGELKEDLIVSQREILLGLQLSLELPRDACMCTKEDGPRRKAGIIGVHLLVLRRLVRGGSPNR